MSWSLPFEQPVPVWGGRHLKTLRDAIKHSARPFRNQSLIMRRFNMPPLASQRRGATRFVTHAGLPLSRLSSATNSAALRPVGQAISLGQNAS